jgi:hypothetical protein
MSEKTVSDVIFEKFANSIKNDALFSSISDDLVLAIRQKQGKSKIKDLLRKMENEDSKP